MKDLPETSEVVIGNTLSLDQWLDLIFSDRANRVLPNNAFPSDKMRDEYLSSIANRTEGEVLKLLRRFLVHSGRYGHDEFILRNVVGIARTDKKQFARLARTEYFRRLLSRRPTWEGNTWVIDLLPHHPGEAINVLKAYFMTYAALMPDFVLSGQLDAMSLIRAKYIEVASPRENLLSLRPRDFELLLAHLYGEMHYDVSLTQTSHDGGVDVVAAHRLTGRKELVLIQCKRVASNVGVKELRELLGVIADRKANRGVLACTAGFTPAARRFADSNPRLELLDWRSVTNLLNEFCGPNWYSRVDWLMSETRRAEDGVKS